MPPSALGRASTWPSRRGEISANETVQLAVLRPRIAVIDEIRLPVRHRRSPGVPADRQMTQPRDDVPRPSVCCITIYPRML